MGVGGWGGRWDDIGVIGVIGGYWGSQLREFQLQRHQNKLSLRSLGSWDGPGGCKTWGQGLKWSCRELLGGPGDL